MGDFLKSVHFYRKVPKDLTEATITGGALSLMSSLVMAYLFFTNFSAFLEVSTRTSIKLDDSDEKKLRIDFNVTMHQLPCRFASLDIVDVMGTHLQNVSSNLLKTRIDAGGRVVGHAPSEHRVVKQAEPLVAKGGAVGASPELDTDSFLTAVKEKQLVMVNFYAPWCPWSRRLQPVWEEAYAAIKQTPDGQHVLMGKSDCTSTGQDLCQKQHIHAFPSVRIYRRHNPHSHESYVGDRTHEAIEAFVKNNVHDADADEATAEGTSEVGSGEGEGCRIQGIALVNRVPGNFHVSAHSKSHSFQPHTLNLTHSVDSMTFGRPMTPAQLRLLNPDVVNEYNSMGGSYFVAGKNMTVEHYLKVVHTSYVVGGSRTLDLYQYIVSNNNYVDGSSLPSAVFSYDISPMQVVVQEERKTMADFLTQLCAIIGGVFTVTGLLDGFLYHSSNTLKRKMEIGKAA